MRKRVRIVGHETPRMMPLYNCKLPSHLQSEQTEERDGVWTDFRVDWRSWAQTTKLDAVSQMMRHMWTERNPASDFLPHSRASFFCRRSFGPP